MVFADKANLLLGAWQCASTLLPILMKLFRFSPYMSGHWVISIEIRSICIRSAFGVAKNCKCYESWYSCLGLQRRVMWNIKRDNPAAIQFCWSGSDKQYWVKRRKQYSSSSKVCKNICQVPNFAKIFSKYQSFQQYSLSTKVCNNILQVPKFATIFSKAKTGAVRKEPLWNPPDVHWLNVFT